MGWIHTGGGWYEDEGTGERIRGKANLPELPETTNDNNLVCMACNKLTAHTQQPINSLEWAIHNCNECGGKTRVSLK